MIGLYQDAENIPIVFSCSKMSSRKNNEIQMNDPEGNVKASSSSLFDCQDSQFRKINIINLSFSQTVRLKPNEMEQGGDTF